MENCRVDLQTLGRQVSGKRNTSLSGRDSAPSLTWCWGIPQLDTSFPLLGPHCTVHSPGLTLGLIVRQSL